MSFTEIGLDTPSTIQSLLHLLSFMTLGIVASMAMTETIGQCMLGMVAVCLVCIAGYILINCDTQTSPPAISSKSGHRRSKSL